jgi:hypothetical protein
MSWLPFQSECRSALRPTFSVWRGSLILRACAGFCLYGTDERGDDVLDG